MSFDQRLANATLSTRLVWPFVEVARALSVPLERGLALVGLDEAMLRRTDQRIAHETADRLLHMAVAATGRADLGLLACEAIEPGHFDLVDIALRSQRTLGEAIATLSNVLALLHDGVAYSLELGALDAIVSFGLRAGLSLHAAGLDFALGALLLYARRETGCTQLSPKSVAFPGARPAHVAALEAFFGCEARFESSSVTATFPAEVLELPLVRADATLQACAERAVCELISSQSVELPFLAKVRAIIAQELPGGDAKTVARRLHIGERTLRRRLADEYTSYRSVLSAVRRELAEKYVAERELSIQAIAEQLGFSTASAFHRAFRSWTGRTVGECRREA